MDGVCLFPIIVYRVSEKNRCTATLISGFF